jgi:hypothetical protein
MGMFRIREMNVRTLYTSRGAAPARNFGGTRQVAGVAADAAVVTTIARDGPVPLFA